MHSIRFGLTILLTHHARQRLVERRISLRLLRTILDEGTIQRKDEQRIWVWINVDGRTDNSLCVAAVLEQSLVVKTVMTHWEPQS